MISSILQSVVLLLTVNYAHSSGKTRLSEVTAITLQRGAMTTGRRSSPVPQLKCVGGCGHEVEAAQCYNRGSDGVDVQWECKADMPNDYRFDKINVICEGYDYPDDPYILRGSCGLEYTLRHLGGGSYGGGQSYASKSYGSDKSPGWVTSIFQLCFVMGIIYVIYKTCLSPTPRNQSQTSHSTTNDDYPDDPPPYNPGYGGATGTPPPYPPGGNTGYGGYDDDADCHNRRQRGGQARGAGGGGPGFFTGAAAGGLLGYLFSGAGRNRGYGGGYNTGYGGGYGGGGSSWGGGGGGSWGGGGGGGGSSSSSGFGGTSRR